MRLFLRISSVILTVTLMGLIFFFSAQDADLSSATSGQVIEFVAEKVYPDFEYLTFTGNSSIFTKNSYAAKTLDKKAAGKDVVNPATGIKNIQLFFIGNMI